MELVPGADRVVHHICILCIHREPTQVASLAVCLKYKEMYGRILKSLNIVNYDRGMSKFKLKINVNLLQLLCMVVSLALLGVFERFGGFCVDCYFTLQEGDKGEKLIFDRSSAKPIFTQKLESPSFQIEHQIN